MIQKILECTYLSFITFLTTTAIAMLLVKWTWIDMIINSGGIIYSSVIFVILFYWVNSYFPIVNDRGIYQITVGTPIILASLLVVAATNGFDLERLLVTPAIVIRNGFFLSGVTLGQINQTVFVILLLGIILSVVVMFSKQFASATSEPARKLSNRQKLSIVAIISIAYVLTVIYTIQPTVRYFINGIFF